MAAPKTGTAGCLNSAQHDGGTVFPFRVLYDGPTPGRRSSVGKAKRPRLTSVEPVLRGVQAPRQHYLFALACVKVNIGINCMIGEDASLHGHVALLAMGSGVLIVEEGEGQGTIPGDCLDPLDRPCRPGRSASGDSFR